jgi:HEAT repeat protein
VINTLGEMGGTANERWLLGVARDEGERQSLRRQALRHARRAGAPMAELVAMYDRTTDPAMKEMLISVYVESGERLATDKLISILRSEENRSLRRRAINHLGKSEDPRVKEALARIVDQ